MNNINNMDLHSWNKLISAGGSTLPEFTNCLPHPVASHHPLKICEISDCLTITTSIYLPRYLTTTSNALINRDRVRQGAGERVGGRRERAVTP